MKNKRVINIIIAVLFFIAYGVFTYAVTTYDRQPIAPDGSLVGFASFNLKAREALGSSELWHELTTVMGFLALLICFIFFMIGLVQLVKGKSLKKVDSDIICLGILYAVVIVLYVFFNKYTINVRPILEDGIAESSYPSSHAMLGITVFGSLLIEIKRRIGDPSKALIESIGCLFFVAITVIGRLLSGIHWATDIIGAVLISIALLFAFNAILPPRKAQNRE